MGNKTIGILLAAGEGTRMKSALPKVLHPVGGLPMICHVLNAMKDAQVRQMNVVVGNKAEKVAGVVEAYDASNRIYIQSERLGTAHAVLAAREAIDEDVGAVLIGYGDTPLVTSSLFQSILDAMKEGADVAVLGFHASDPHGYGRLLVEDGQLVAIREEKDANERERQVTLCNSGIMGINGKVALDLLDAVDNENAKGEYYLTDIVEIANARSLKIAAVEGREVDTLGVNNRAELAEAEAIYQDRLREILMMAGVSMIDPKSCHFSFDTTIGHDTIIEPNCFFAPGVSVESDVVIKANSYLEGDLKKNQTVLVKSGAVVGPFARLRPGAILEKGSKVGNFCEVKNAHIGEDAKVNHLTYIGDSDIGRSANIGAGTITCNYDGFSKFKTRVGEGAFVGSNSSLVAPVSIGAGAYVGSGSVITEDVSENALAIGRGRQAEKQDWASQFRKKNEK